MRILLRLYARGERWAGVIAALVLNLVIVLGVIARAPVWLLFAHLGLYLLGGAAWAVFGARAERELRDPDWIVRARLARERAAAIKRCRNVVPFVPPAPARRTRKGGGDPPPYRPAG